jgi:hypothetical protein
VDGEAGLDLVVGEQRAVLPGELANAFQVAGLRRDDAGVHHHRFHDHAGDLVLMIGEDALHGLEVVERHHQGQPHHLRRDAAARGHAVRAVGRTQLGQQLVHRHLHRVVMAVIGALDLDDLGTPGDRPHEVDGIHGRLGSGVGEPPQREAESPGQLLGHHDGVLGGLGEVGAPGHPGADRLDDLGMSVTDRHDAVAPVQVDVLESVGVVDLRALPMADPDGLGPGDLPAGRDAPGQRSAGPVRQLGRARLACQEPGLLLGDELVQAGQVPLRHPCSHLHPAVSLLIR